MQRVFEAGLESLRNGRLDDAAAAFREVLRGSPDHPDAHYLLAHTALLGGQLADAERHVGLALQAAPDQPDFHLLRGNIAQRGGDLARAEEGYRAALRLAPDYAEAQLNLGNALGEQGRADEALAAYAAALELKPELLAAALNRAALLARLGRGAEARAGFADLAARHPQSTELMYLHARLELDAGSEDAALERLEALLARAPEHRQALAAAAALHARKGAPGKALGCWRRLISLDPADREARLRAGVLLSGMGRHRAALAELAALRSRESGWVEAHAAYADACMRAGREQDGLAAFDGLLKLEPAHFAARVSRALILGRRGEREAALASLEALDAESPRQPHVLNGIGLQLRALGRVREAAARFAAAYDADPAFAAANANLAAASLLLGDFARGWRHQGNKWRGGELKKHARSFACPLWQGEPLEGRSLLVWSEQGLGDQIMFAGMFPDLAAAAVLECHPRLAPLFARSFASAAVLARGDARLAGMRFDFHAPMSALGEYLRPSWEAFPRHLGYLKPDAARRAAWRARLDALGAGLKVGISWRGGTADTGGAARSSALADWGALLGQQGARFVSLQYGKCEPEIERLRAGGLALAHWPEAIDDFEESAALVSELDLVVSVTTTVIHLAGALGKPVWVLVPAFPGWRYLLEGEAMPWYPSARLLRQERAGDWPPVISRAAGDLAAALAARR